MELNYLKRDYERIKEQYESTKGFCDKYKREGEYHKMHHKRVQIEKKMLMKHIE